MMVATKRVPLAEVDNGKERRGGTNEGGSGLQEPLGGFIFVCNNDTMGEDFERHLFGLPQRYHDSVKAIQPGLPLFLYNYSTRCLHGVFEASSDGGLNIEPDAWGENKDSRKNGRQSLSRFPAQVRVRWREERPPLEEEKFRPVLYHYDGPKFRLQLSKSEAHELLKLFGASPVRKMEEVLEDTGGEWEKVKTKSKPGRGFRAPLAKGSISPNSSGGRRRGTAQNGSSSNGGASHSSLNNSVHEAVSRGRERDIRSDSAQRWRTDSDSWSGSSSAGTTSSNCGLYEEDRSKKGPRENGYVAEMIEASGLEGGLGFDGMNGIASSGGFLHTNGSVDPDYKVDIRLIEEDSNELNGFSSSNNMGMANSNTRSGFVSYSAALKSGMLAAAENGLGESLLSAPSTDNLLSSCNNQGNLSTTISYSSAATAATLSPSSPSGTSKGDLALDRVDGANQKLGGLNKVRVHGEGVASNHIRGGPGFVENGKQEMKVDSLTNGNGDGKRIERLSPWGKPLIARASPPEVGTGQSTVIGDNKSVVKTSGDSSTLPRRLAKDGLKTDIIEGENGDKSIGHQRHGRSEAKENAVKISETPRKNAWQSNDGAVLRLLHDPDPAVNSSSMNVRKAGQEVELEVAKKQEEDLTPSLERREVVVQPPVEKGELTQPLPANGRQAHNPKQLLSSSGALNSHGSQSKPLSHEAPLYHQTRIVHEPRRQQFDSQKHEKHQEDRSHSRKQQGHPQEHLQHSASMLHNQSHQLGQGLMPLHIPTPAPPGMQQHHHHPILSPSPQTPLYRDRSRTRGANGSVDNVHGLAYRPISRNMLDGDVALQSPLVPGSWGLQSPVLLMQPVISPVTGNFTFPTPAPHMLTNVKALHAEILEFAQAARPSAETRLHAEAAVECVRGSVKQLWPEADVEVFGSFATGLCLHHSDVDVVVVDAPPPEDTPGNASFSGARLLTPLIRALASALKDNLWCEGLNTIETASMPVIKLRCSPNVDRASASPSVAIDITIGGKRSEIFAGISQAIVQRGEAGIKRLNPKFEAARNAHNGAAAREFVIERLRQLPALAPLVLLLKSFLRCRSLNDVYSGGLGSFALTLMLVFYLERVPISCGTPQEIPQSTKSPSTATVESSASSVDIPQASSATAESVDSSDDDSSDSSVLTSTSASSMASTEVASLLGSSSGGDHASTAANLSTEEPLLRKAGGIVEELLASMHSVASPNLGTLLVGFLHFFGQEIDFSRVRLVLKGRNGSLGGLFWHEKNARTLPLWIDDPLRPDANIGAGSFNIWQVQAAMRDMLSAITMPPSDGSHPLSDGQRVGKGPGRRRQLPLLQQFLVNNMHA